MAPPTNARGVSIRPKSEGGSRPTGTSHAFSSGVKLGAKKKMTIKPFKKAPTLPDSFEDETWKKLEAALHDVNAKQPTSLSREELYRAVEDLCTWKMAARLYERLTGVCASTIKTRVDTLESAGSDADVFLSAVDNLWQDHCDNMLTVRTIFLYLDRTYVVQTPHVASIWDMGLHSLRDQVVARPALESRLLSALLELIDRERRGETVNRSSLYNVLRMLTSLQLYNRFETPFLTSSEQFYASEGASLVSESSVKHFLRHVESRLQEEGDRVVHYLDNSTHKRLVHTVESHLLQPHVHTLLERGLQDLLDQVQVDDLQRMYALFGRVDARDDLKQAFSTYIKAKVSAMVQDVEQEKHLVENLLAFKQCLDKVLKESFHSSAEFTFALKSAMEHGVNARASRPAELVAKFVDGKLRQGNKGGSESEVEALLDRVMVIFRYLQGKDVFEAFYKKDLAKRLLVGKSASFDLEKLMLAKLKTECGSSFTMKLEGMFKDIDVSNNMMTQFQQHAASQSKMEALGKPRPDMHVQVLTTGFWPPYPSIEMTMPTELTPLKDIFEQFYASKYQGRQLQWQHSLANCVVRARFPKAGRKELLVSLFQTIVLLCFNANDRVSLKQLKEETRLEDGELKRTCQSLACGKVRVLQKEPRGKDVNDDDEFVFNAKFTNALHRIKINSIQMRETPQEAKDTHERVFRDRQYQVDAAIVRIMKARKKLSHPLLMAEIFNQVRFPAKATDVKRRIESLIDREYLERDAEDQQMYNYLA